MRSPRPWEQKEYVHWPSPLKADPGLSPNFPRDSHKHEEAFSYVCCFALISLMLKSRPVEEQSRSGSKPIQGSFLGKVWENFLYILTQNTSDTREFPCGPVVRTQCFHCSGTKILPTTLAKKKNTSDIRRMGFFPTTNQFISLVSLQFNSAIIYLEIASDSTD